MNLQLKRFQTEKVEELVRRSHQLTRDLRDDDDAGALMLASPTGSGKTVMATAWMERILEGDGDHAPDAYARFLWITDSPELNTQSRQKVLAASTVFLKDDVVTIDSSFDQETLDAGKLYFLNTGKVSKGTYLTSEGDKRKFTIWETISNTVAQAPGSFWVIIDEAHKGMVLNRNERREANSIVQKFLLGSPGEIPPVPLVFGISATPQRFVDLLNSAGKLRSFKPVEVTPEEVRSSGLLKDEVVVYHPTDTQPSDWTMLRDAAEQWEAFRTAWDDYTAREHDPPVDPILVVQVEDAPSNRKSATKTDLEKAIDIIEQVTGALRDDELAHSFQEETAIAAGTRSIRHIPASAIQNDPTAKVVFFKRSLTTGWDCPRAEVMMSFRRAVDHTAIAQLIGRVVRTPLARSVPSNEFLSSVALYLPHYDSAALKKVVEYLRSDEPGAGLSSGIRSGAETLNLPRRPDAGDCFAAATALPTYSVERIPKQSNVRRLLTLSRALNYDKLDTTAPDRARTLVVDILEEERSKRSGDDGDLTDAVKSAGEISLAAVRLAYGHSNGDTTRTSTVTIAAAQENIDDLFAAARRQIGEGLHLEFVRRRIDADGAHIANQAKLELFSLLNIQDVLSRLESETGSALNADYIANQAATLTLPESRRAIYRRVRREAKDPEHEPLALPDVIQVVKGKTIWDRHLFVDEGGSYPWDSKSGWEIDVLKIELERNDVEGWLRNTERKDWALAVPYWFDGRWQLTYPDLLVFRRTSSGILVDILEPHAPSHDDSWAKAVGLAKYAQKHGAHFGRIEMIVKDKARWVRLNVNDPEVRKAALKLDTNQQLRALYGI